MERSVRYCLPMALVLAFAISGCGATRSDSAAGPSAPVPATRPNTARLAATPATTPISTPTATPIATSTETSGAAFVGDISAVTAADLPHSWRPGCPVGPDQLSLLRLSYWGFDNQPHVGSLVVHKAVAHDVVTVFRAVYRARFPIRQMQPVDAFGGSDDASMAADNTSGFNCRNAVTSGPPRWSAHAYGRAIDVNPVENPYLLGGRTMPPAGAAYIDRAVHRPGMAFTGGTLVEAFQSVGWKWRGTASSAPDYQHFSTTGG
jgi:hypothetical protein